MDIKYFAKLARLELQADEKEKFSHDLEKIVGYIDQLKEVEAEASREIREHTNILREDERREVMLAEGEALLTGSPDRAGDWVKVKPIFGDSK